MSRCSENGRPSRLEYAEIDHCCQRFCFLDEWLEAEGRQRRGVVGHAEARLARACDIVEVSSVRLRRQEDVFLHSPGADLECDEARQSLAG